VRAGEHHGADIGVFVEGLEGVVELEDEEGEEGVEGFGAVELDCAVWSAKRDGAGVHTGRTQAYSRPRCRDLDVLIALLCWRGVCS